LFSWRAQTRARLLNRTVPNLMGQYPLELGMILWGTFAFANAITGEPPSTALQKLPDELEVSWALLMGVAASVTLLGLFTRLLGFVASGMQAYGAILGAYGCAIMASAGWQKGGSIAGFLFIIGTVCFVRGWWLREEDAARAKERHRTDDDEQASDAPN
jgi:hypothetical protein